MRIGWIHDDPGYLGGAELSMVEFKAAAPVGVEIVDCPAGDITPGLDRYVVGNCMSYAREETGFAVPAIRYHHDVSRAPADIDFELDGCRHIFCSPLQRERMGMEHFGGACIPPALDLDHFKAYANQNHRQGAVCIGRMAYGKGLELLAEYPETVDVYSSIPVSTEGNARYRGMTSDVAETLSKYERFIFLPTAIEPFGRAVVEAWAAGLDLVVNKNVGALHWIRNEPEKLKSAGEDFWNAVLA